MAGVGHFKNIYRASLGKLQISVTRLGEISPLWPIFKRFWLFLDGLHFCQNVQPTLAIFYAEFVDFGKYRTHNLAIWSH